MADEAGGGLLIQIGVTQARMEREIAGLVKSAAKSANDIEKNFTSANNNIAKSSTAAFSRIPKAANDAAAGVKNTTFAVSNLTSQLNDIGVQLAGGQSPFQVMLQQGTQIGQLFTQTGGSFKTFGSILAGAAMSAISPFNLLTFAVIGLGGYAIQYFSKLIQGGQDSNAVIEEQQSLIIEVAKAWGDAVPALQDYVNALANAQTAADALSAGNALASLDFAPVRKDVADLNVQFADIISTLGSMDGTQATVGKLQDAWQRVNDAVANGRTDFVAMNDVQDALSSAIDQTGIPMLTAFANAFDTLRQHINATAGAAAAAQAQIVTALTGGANVQDIISQSTYRDNGQLKRTPSSPAGTVLMDDGSYAGIPKPSDRPSTESEFPGGTWNKPKAAKAARGANSYKDEVASITERTKALQEGTAAQAAINPLVNDFGYALEKAKTEQALLADAQKSGLTITPQLREQISALADTYAQASAQSKELAKSQADIRKQAEEWASLEKDTFKGFLSDLKDGKSGAEALSNALNKVADKLLDMAMESIFNTKGAGGVTGSGGSGIFGSIFGGIGKLFGFASGTANTGSRPGTPVGIVHGQEAVIPLPSGGRVPVTIATPKANAQKSSNDTVSINLTDDSGRMAAIANQQIQTASGTIVHVAVTQSYKQVKGNMAGLMTDAQARAL